MGEIKPLPKIASETTAWGVRGGLTKELGTKEFMGLPQRESNECRKGHLLGITIMAVSYN
jgi:hypothetical protein